MNDKKETSFIDLKQVEDETTRSFSRVQNVVIRHDASVSGTGASR
ncbi:MAG: hypothetical protein ACLR8P_21585 [Clostridium fessum]